MRGCLEWMGDTDMFWNGKTWELARHYAHRQMHPTLKADRLVRFLCRNGRCVRLDHLECGDVHCFRDSTSRDADK